MDAITPQNQLLIDKSLQVYQLLACNPRMTQEQACKNVGIDPKTYRKWIATQDEAIKVFEQTRLENERMEYAEYLASKSAISFSLIQDAMKPDVPVPVRIKALEYIDQKINEYSGRYHTVDIEAEQDLLSGPRQELGTSKLANRVIIEDKENETVIRVKDKLEVIDIQPDSSQ